VANVILLNVCAVQDRSNSVSEGIRAHFEFCLWNYVAISILFDGDIISFDASLVIYTEENLGCTEM